MKVYFDHASTTCLDEAVFEKMRLSFMQEWGNPNSTHAVGRRAQNALDESRERLAELLNARFKEIYFTSGGTEADNLAIKGIMKAATKKTVLVSAIEHSAVLAAAQDLLPYGYKVEYLSPNAQGVITPEELRAHLSEDVALVSVMFANNETGVLNPVSTLAAIAHEGGALFHTDAVQAANSENLDVKALGVDLLTLSAHKFYGPKGAGLLYVREGVPIRSIISGGFQERGVRGGTVNVPLAVGLAEAYDRACKNREERMAATKAVQSRFEARLSEMEGVFVNFVENRTPNVSNVRFAGVNAQALLTALDLEGISASVGSACTAGSVLPSHVLKASGLTDEQVAESMRFSYGYKNTVEEADAVADFLAERLPALKGKRLFLSMQKDPFLG